MKFVQCFSSGDAERDIFNEKPSKEELVAATQVGSCFINGTLLCFCYYSYYNILANAFSNLLQVYNP